MRNNIEFMILDWIQNVRTPACDLIMCFITRLGDAGIIWIALAAVMPWLPKTRKTGIVMMIALCIDLAVCNGILKNSFARIRPCDINTQI